jgi:hypothetical protein
LRGGGARVEEQALCLLLGDQLAVFVDLDVGGLQVDHRLALLGLHAEIHGDIRGLVGRDVDLLELETAHHRRTAAGAPEEAAAACEQGRQQREPSGKAG